jgi:hypothetical protein
MFKATAPFHAQDTSPCGAGEALKSKKQLLV